MSSRIWLSSLLLWALSQLTSPCLAQEAAVAEKSAKPKAKKAEGTKFMRLTKDDDGELKSMDTAIVRYVPIDAAVNSGLVVDLIGVVHIGGGDYYEQLVKEFEQYDALLYELVAPEGSAPKKGEQRGGSPVSALQNGMKDMLGLEFQLSHIDYRTKNFVHADMSPDDFSKSMASRGESIWTMFLRSMGQGIAQESKAQQKGGGGANMNFLMALMSKDRPMLLRRMMAEQFEDLEGAMNAFGGPDGSTIITERNKVALKVLEKQIGEGKKKLGVFYGAGHMPDMEERLKKDFQLKPADQKWLVAWDLAMPKAKTAGTKPPSDKPVEKN